MRTTVGQLLINEALPEQLRDYNRVIDKKGMTTLFSQLADKGPEAYRDMSHALHNLGGEVSTVHGREASFSLNDLKMPEAGQKMRDGIEKQIQAITHGSGKLADKNNQIVSIISENLDKATKLNYDEALKENNPFAMQILSGSRGSASQFRSMRMGDMLLVDHKDRPIPIPVMRSYAEGVDAPQYWAAAYGARKGAIATKFATPKSGYLGKQLIYAAHRMVVTEKDCGTTSGIAVPASDPDNEGAVIAKDHGDVTAGTILGSRTMKSLGEATVTVRSPITCRARNGVCQKCAGVRERGGFSPIGDNIGVAAAQAVSEPIGQGQLSEKHTGGMAGGKSNKSGMDLVNQLVQVPRTFQGGAAIASTDGRVTEVKDAAQGGRYIVVGGVEHWVPSALNPKVKVGDEVEAGDVISEGIPNPALIAQHKGIGEGRRHFVDIMRETLKDGGFPAHRRNIEILARGLVNHVRVTDLDGPADTIPDDMMEYDNLARDYKPRAGFQVRSPKESTGLYLEEPVLHYSIGTRITPRVAKTMGSSKVGSVKVHADKPSFVPEMTRSMETLAHSDDWMVRLGGLYGVKRSVIQSAQRGGGSEVHGTSYIPALAQGVDFGKDVKTKGTY